MLSRQCSPNEIVKPRGGASALKGFAWFAVILFGMSAFWCFYRATRDADEIGPVHDVMEDSHLGALTALTLTVRCFPHTLKEVGIEAEGIRMSVEARLKDLGITILPETASPCPSLELTIALDGSATKEVLLSDIGGVLKGDALLAVSHPGERWDSVGWTKRCDFACIPRNVPRTVRGAVDCVLDAFIADYGKQKGMRKSPPDSGPAD